MDPLYSHVDIVPDNDGYTRESNISMRFVWPTLSFFRLPAFLTDCCLNAHTATIAIVARGAAVTPVLAGTVPFHVADPDAISQREWQERDVSCCQHSRASGTRATTAACSRRRTASCEDSIDRKSTKRNRAWYDIQLEYFTGNNNRLTCMLCSNFTVIVANDESMRHLGFTHDIAVPTPVPPWTGKCCSNNYCLGFLSL